ncbi:invasion associated locus B family protein [Fodinicurvata sp. EGI_FJ10296]|uniref:invasion associated locus B family protein n=1 Tax=Fodinicurvata sp. EGI_FJ10296 TaxID=3231908 RepID=UPI0034551462
MNAASAAALGITLALFSWTGAAQSQQNERPIRFGAWLPGNVMESRGDWGVRCEGSDPEADLGQCEIIQNVSPIGSSAVLMHAAAGWAGDGLDPLAVLVFPLGVHLPSGVRIDGGADGGRTADYQICTERGCQIELRVDDDLMSTFAAQDEVQIVVRSADMTEIGIPLSLDGFAAALNLVDSLEP